MKTAPEPASPQLRVLIVDDHPVVRQGLRAILQSQPDIRVLAEAASGEALLPAGLASKLAAALAQPELSERERQILQSMAEGRSNKEIGPVLYISENTVKHHVKSVLKKLDAAGRTEAVAIATKRGLLRFAI